ncbi:tail fiber assembly protein [Escherichia coli]|nr:tail fiber assembly protein [Escherichia coli]EFC6634202.1 tail fiber assembly protein [Escherichia coli]
MIYFKMDNGDVYAYSEQTIQKVNRIDQLESLADDAAVSELSAIDKVFFEIREKINTMRKMTDEEVEAHINPPKSHEDLVSEANAEKNRLIQNANDTIAPLQDAVDLDMATDEEISLLAEWKKYRVLLMRVDTTKAPDIEWPPLPISSQ